MKWFAIMWYDMIWYDMIWYDMIWYDMIWYDMIWYDSDMIWYDTNIDISMNINININISLLIFIWVALGLWVVASFSVCSEHVLGEISKAELTLSWFSAKAFGGVLWYSWAGPGLEWGMRDACVKLEIATHATHAPVLVFSGGFGLSNIVGSVWGQLGLLPQVCLGSFTLQYFF